MDRNHFMVAMYLRLSRDDHDVEVMHGNGTGRCESGSIGNQRELIRAFIHGQQDMELYDVYVDDGFTGSNFDRPEFKRMMRDVEAGKVNCVIVKDLSRFGRDYIESGRYIQKVFPALSVRFIALTDHYDSFRADTGESGILLPVKNFINDSYCRDISMKVKSQFEVKRKKGECIAPFAPYGYRKSENHKNRLVVDTYAAEIVKKIFEWKIEGFAISAIAEKLNELGILSPREYKKSTGTNYRGGFSGTEKSRWSSSAVKRILTNETYLGHLLQGKTEKINYKLKKTVEKPREEWVRVKNTHEAILSEDTFWTVQNLLRTDGRVSPDTRQNSLFAGLLFCADCGEQMIRRVNRCRNTQKLYYICSTKNRSEGCSRHSIEEDALKEVLTESIRSYLELLADREGLLEKVLKATEKVDGAALYDDGIERLQKEKDKYEYLCLSLYKDWKQGVITKEEAKRLHTEFKQRMAEIKTAQEKQEEMKREAAQQEAVMEEQLRKLQEQTEWKVTDRHMLCRMVKRIFVYEEKRLEIEFSCRDIYRRSGG